MQWVASVVWLVLLVGFAIIEAATVGLVSIWFAAGALAALLSTFFTGNIWLQIGLFLVVSAVTMALVRPLVGKYITPKQVATNADRVVGSRAVVTETIDDLNAAGAVKAAGVEWSARSTTGETIPVGSTVVVDRIEGVKLYVTRKAE